MTRARLTAWLWRIVLGVCRHDETYRERRPLGGVDVLHFVCRDCGYAAPMINRSAADHARATELGRPSSPTRLTKT